MLDKMRGALRDAKVRVLLRRTLYGDKPAFKCTV